MIDAALRRAVEDPPRVCAPALWVGGRIRARPEDFGVEELPAYPADGKPGHVLTWMQKRSLTTEAALRELAKILRVPRVEIGVAGLKDHDALTRQRVSLPERAAPGIERFRHPKIVLEGAEPHSHKLRRGHLEGNRFCITLRELEPELSEARARAQAVFDQLGAQGLPNAYGAQRFGKDARNLEPGLAALAGKGPRGKKANLTLSAGQSALFNLYVSLRARQGQCRAALAGDILKKRESGGLFECEQPELDQGRLDAGELVVTGPMFGSKMRAPSPGTTAAALETEVLEIAKISPAKLLRLGRAAPGTRRPLLVWPELLAIRDAAPVGALGPGLELEFVLPAGSYATMVLRELTGPRITRAS